MNDHQLVVRTLHVFNDGKHVGVLHYDPESNQDPYTFIYDDGLAPKDQISLTMPVAEKVYHYNKMLPVLEMTMPEELDPRVARLAGKSVLLDDMGRLFLAGQRKIGHLQVGLDAEAPPEIHGIRLSPELIENIGDGIGLFEDLLMSLGGRQGIAGAQPKTMFRMSRGDSSEGDELRQRTLRTDSHILKCITEDYPAITLNEHLCMRAAQVAGIPAAKTLLSKDGRLLAIKRFDVVEDHVIGFEEAGTLQGYISNQKYKGSYEAMAKTIKAATSGEDKQAAMEHLFSAVALSVGVANGDFHQKNFGLIYTNGSRPTAAPLYDCVTTTAYAHLAADVPALTLQGRKVWFNKASLKKFGTINCGLSPRQADDIMASVADAVDATMHNAHLLVDDYAETVPGAREIFERMQLAWKQGAALLRGEIKLAKDMKALCTEADIELGSPPAPNKQQAPVFS